MAAHDRVADGEVVHAVADRSDGASRLAAGNERWFRTKLILSCQHQHVDILHAARDDADLDLTGTGWRRIGNLAQRQDFRATEPLTHHRFHWKMLLMKDCPCSKQTQIRQKPPFQACGWSNSWARPQSSAVK